MSASETHNLSNLRMTREQSFAQLAEVVALAHAAKVPVNVSLSCVFGCPMEGDVDPAVVSGWVDRFADLGVAGVTLCDTTGMAYPTQVQSICADEMARHPTLTVHRPLPQHARHGARATPSPRSRPASAARHVARRHRRLSVCARRERQRRDRGRGPHADCMGYDCGIDVDALIGAAGQLAGLVEHDLPAQVSRAGVRLTQHEPPADFAAIRERAIARDGALRPGAQGTA